MLDSSFNLLVFLSRWFHLAFTGFVPSKTCSGRLVNCASEPPMRGNGEIAHAGVQKLAEFVAQLVITVHFTALPLRYTFSVLFPV